MNCTRVITDLGSQQGLGFGGVPFGELIRVQLVIFLGRYEGAKFLETLSWFRLLALGCKTFSRSRLVTYT